MEKLEYIDKRPIFIPKMTFYRSGLRLPNTDNIIKVTATEKKHLLKMRNGKSPSFREVKPKREEKPEMMEV